jgi:geranylgeranyl pyrophosphate synthase
LKAADPKDKKRLVQILEMHTSDGKLRSEAIKIMQKYDSIKYAKDFATRIVEESWKEVEKLLPPSDAKDKLKAFAEFLIKRKI